MKLDKHNFYASKTRLSIDYCYLTGVAHQTFDLSVSMLNDVVGTAGGRIDRSDIIAGLVWIGNTLKKLLIS